jgi:hypothetical protein
MLKALMKIRAFLLNDFWQTFCLYLTSMKQMKKNFLHCLCWFSSLSVFAQVDSVLKQKYIVENDILSHKKVVFQRIQQQYMTNENQYVLDLKIDTSYLLLIRSDKNKQEYTASYFEDADCKKPYLKSNDIEKIPLQLKFNRRGKLIELVNWKIFRDEFLKGISNQVRANLMSAADFEFNKKRLNNEAVIRRMAIEDIGYLFSLNGDTFTEDVEYLRVKAVRSPFTSKDFQILGSLKFSKPPGTNNTLLFQAQNKAGKQDKIELMQECKDYLEANNKEKVFQTEITAVGLNSEQEYTYNTAQRRMLMVKFSDVLSINLQARGNIRAFKLFDFE